MATFGCPNASCFMMSFLVVLTFGFVNGMTCSRETFFGITEYFTCPRPGDRNDFKYCCGGEKTRTCCNTAFGIDEKAFNDMMKNLPTILGVIASVIIGMIVLCILCCCCCPFCMIYKRRNRGAVHQPTTSTSEVRVMLQPQQQNQSQPTAAPYPTGPQPYPVQPYAAQPYPAQPPYPAQQCPGGQPPYPTQAYPTAYSVEQPPPYSEKQPAFNPNYGQPPH